MHNTDDFIHDMFTLLYQLIIIDINKRERGVQYSTIPILDL